MTVTATTNAAAIINIRATRNSSQAMWRVFRVRHAESLRGGDIVRESNIAYGSDWTEAAVLNSLRRTCPGDDISVTLVANIIVNGSIDPAAQERRVMEVVDRLIADGRMEPNRTATIADALDRDDGDDTRDADAATPGMPVISLAAEGEDAASMTLWQDTATGDYIVNTITTQVEGMVRAAEVIVPAGMDPFAATRRAETAYTQRHAMTRAAAADALGISQNRVTNMIRDGRLHRAGTTMNAAMRHVVLLHPAEIEAARDRRPGRPRHDA